MHDPHNLTSSLTMLESGICV